MSDELILQHYRKIAKKYGLSGLSAMEDPYVREAEVAFVIKEIKNFEKRNQRPFFILDAGCGNGYLISILSELFPKHQFVGLEFTPELYEIAASRKHDNVLWVHGDLRKSDWLDREFDLVITERVLINIRKVKEQFEAVGIIAKALRKGGRYIMIESFRDSLNELNEARKEMGLDLAKESYQNRYLYTDYFEKIEKSFGLQKISTEMPHNYLSTHFFITRVFHKALRPKGGKVKFSRFAKFFTEALPPAIGNFATINFYLFEKMSDRS